MAKRSLKTYKTYGFRIYIYQGQKDEGLKRQGVIALLDKHGQQRRGEQVPFDYLDEIPVLIRKRLQQLEKLEKA